MRVLLLICSAILPALLIFGCGSGQQSSFDAAGGVVEKDYQLTDVDLQPIPVRTDSDFDLYYVREKLVFVGNNPEQLRALTVEFRWGLNDERLKRAERDFSGYFFDGKGWRVLPYTRARQDSTNLLQQRSYYFGGLQWSDTSRAGSFFYDRRGRTLGLVFDSLAPVQYYRNSKTALRLHEIGNGVLRSGNDTTYGTVYYQLEELAGYNPITEKGAGIDLVNYDWLALVGDDGAQLLAASDSSTGDNRLYKNFIALEDGTNLRYADGSDNFRIHSDLIRRDFQITDFLALKKKASVPGLGIELNLDLSDKRFFYTSGFALAIVSGELTVDGQTQAVWGILEHKQRPHAEQATLK